jgi:superoxide dismutase, Fe-Mn family
MKPYVLPDLDYDVAALEPHISGEIMALHHGKHHKAYVDAANQTLEKIEEARGKNDFSAVAGLERSLAFNVSGHALHSIFWKNLRPAGGGSPGGELARQVALDFGSFEGMKAQLTETAATIMGSGWGALVWEPLAKRLLTVQIHDHQSNTALGAAPLMVIDAWEHAYYLQYKNQKVEFFKAVWNLWNWDDISTRFERASHQGAETVRAASRKGEAVAHGMAAGPPPLVG